MKTLFLILLLCFASCFVFADDGNRLLREIDQEVIFDTDFTAEYQVIQQHPGEGQTSQTLAMFRRDRDNKFTIVVMAPAIDQGKGYLKVNNNLWFYDPNGGRFVLTSAKDRFQNSNARNSDFTRSSLALDYRVASIQKATLGSFQTQLLQLEATNDSVTFPHVKIWVTSDHLIRKREDYSLSGQLLRISAIPQYQKVGRHWVPVTMVIVDTLKGREIGGVYKNDTTIIKISKPSLDAIPDLVFTQAYLQKVAR